MDIYLHTKFQVATMIGTMKSTSYKYLKKKKGKRKVQGVPQSQTAALPRPQEEEETDKSKQAQTEQTYEKHLALSSPSEVIAILKGLKNTRTK